MSSCVKNTSDKIIKIEEGGKPLYFENTEKTTAEVGHVDGCIVGADEDVERCDYYLRTDDKSLYLIEFKGSDIAKAVRQIKSTIEHLFKAERSTKKIGIIVCNRNPKHGTDFQNAKLRLAKFAKANSLKLEQPKQTKATIKI